MMRERKLGAVRSSDFPDGFVSTIYRESSALVDPAPRYFETMAFHHEGRILWMSAASSEAEADRQHDLAVRWFSRLAAA